LLRYLIGDGVATRQQQLKEFSLPVSVENETKSWSFLETRAQLLLKAYTTTVEVNCCAAVADVQSFCHSANILLTIVVINVRKKNKNIKKCVFYPKNTKPFVNMIKKRYPVLSCF